jgi:60 kDa SS-A/Ro ribonucleoprotein
MSRFNTSRLGTATTNLAGGKAYKQTDKLELVSTLLTTFVQDTFYKSGANTQATIKNLVSSIEDKKFVAKTAIYARDVFNMRTASHIVAGEIAGQVHGEPWLKNFYNKIIVRPDDMLEILAYLKKNNIKIPNALKKGFAQALQSYSEYELGKYKKTSKTISLVDVVNLVHPKPTPATTALIKGTLANPETWEVLITQAGSDIEAKKAAWRKLVLEKKLGYMALIRNLRNILEYANDTIDEACLQLTDPVKIAKSRMLPFRFFTAIDEVEKLNLDGVRKVIVALSQALDIALNNAPELPGKTLVVVDESGSMQGKPGTIASMFAAILVKTNPNADLMYFRDTARNMHVNPLDTTLSIARNMHFNMGGTNFHSIFETASKAYDRIIILSDMQGWIEWNTPVQSFQKYKIRTGANPLIYSWDLQNTGTMLFPETNVFAIAGWSDKVFDVMKLLETDKHALFNEINKIEL